MGNFIWDSGYDLKEGSTGDFVKWLSTNEAALREATPAGIDYIGTYAAVQSSEKTAGRFHTLFGANSYGDMDTFASAAADGEFGRLLDEMFRFSDQSNTANGSMTTLKSATATTYWGDN
jgi:hypothetical protein